MKQAGFFWDAWWPQWRSHWHVLHAWPVSAQALLLSALTLLMSLCLSWQVSGEAWLTWWQAQEREEEATLVLHKLQQQAQQHLERVAALKAMPHPTGADWPAWVALSASGLQTNPFITAQALAPTGVQVQAAEGADRQQWAGSLPSLLMAWQTLSALTPQTRVTAFVLRADSAVSAPKAASPLSLQLLTREDAEQTLSSKASLAKPSAHGFELARTAPPTPLFNPFDMLWLAEDMPPLARASGQLKLPDAELSQWQWVGALSAPGKSSALLSFGGEIYAVAPGQALGADGGEITQVHPDHLWLREWQVNHQGHWQARLTRLPAQGSP